MTTKYVTTPIYYVNGVPHIGSAYCTLATDTLARYWREKLGPDNVFFLTGTDENSQKTVDAAAKAGQSIETYLADMAANWRTTFEQIGIEFDDFIRTTEDRHIKTVHELFEKIHANDDIYKGTYKGLYCTGCETFLKESELTEEGYCPQHLKPPKEIAEENYFFRLSKYEQPLLDFYEQNPNWLQPAKRRNEVVNFIKDGLEDISVSRETAEFGIPLPLDPAHKIYVWFDALINYYTATREQNREKFWDSAYHIIGKDITRFHCIIWPAMLMSVGLPLPQGVFAHGFFTVNGHKMSKSLGNVVNPLDLSAKYGNDALRLGLLSSFEFGNDGDFSAANFADFYHSKLAGGVGNLFNRVIVLINKFLDGHKPNINVDPENHFYESFAKALESYKIKESIDAFFSAVQATNELLNETEVWKLAKVDIDKASEVFATLLQRLEIIKNMGKILLPESCKNMESMLGDENKVGAAVILFPRIED